MGERLKKIVEELNEIATQLEEDENLTDEQAKELEEKSAKLIAEKRSIKERMEQRQAILKEVRNGKGETIAMADFSGMESKKEAEERHKKEYKSAFLKNLRGLDLTEAEKRAFSTASDSAGAVIPIEIQEEILTKLKQRAPLLEEITLLHVEGNVSFAVEGVIADAEKHTENAAITADTDTLVEVKLSAYEITKLIQISKSVMKMSIKAFETWLVEMITERLARKIIANIINGSGTGEATGINGGITWDSTNSITVGASASLTTKNVLDLIAALPGGYDPNAKFLMSKKTFYTEFKPLQDSSKNDIVVSEGNKHFILGYPVMLDENVTIKEAFLGDFKKYVGNLAEEMNVTGAPKLSVNGFEFLGSAMFDGKPGIKEAFVKLIKATA